MKENVFDLLKSRGFICQTSDETGLKNALNKPVTVYQGFDPSDQSLHLGHLLGLMALHHLQEAGHKVIFLLGGGTGRVGDPSGKSKTRNLLTRDVTDANAASLKKQVEKIGLLTFSGSNPALMLNNDTWLSEFKFLDDFLIGIARHFSVNDLVAMRTFEERLNKGQALSLLEFCYPALQAWDFLELFKRHKCTFQLGGDDQWANILAGVELIRKETGGTTVFAATLPLLTTASGEKMGKTVGGAVWLDTERTSPFEFFQYLRKTDDKSVPKLLKLFTFLPLEEINEIVKNPIEAQKRLAFEVTKIVHGEEEAKKAMESESMPEFSISKDGVAVIDALFDSGVLPSRSEAKRRIEQGGVSIGEEKITDIKAEVNEECVIRFGKSGFLKIVIK